MLMIKYFSSQTTHVWKNGHGPNYCWQVTFEDFCKKKLYSLFREWVQWCFVFHSKLASCLATLSEKYFRKMLVIAEIHFKENRACRSETLLKASKKS